MGTVTVKVTPNCESLISHLPRGREWELIQLRRKLNEAMHHASVAYQSELAASGDSDAAWLAHEGVVGNLREQVRTACDQNPDLFPIPAEG